MANKMLIDASHPEETRVVVVRGNRIEEFDFESQDKKQLKGNIYLARVTRVEPSLQAAFVEYGGNRHGFLAFSEIHPDYYQIPVADRQALLRAEAEEHAEDDDDEPEGRQKQSRKRRRGSKARPRDDDSTSSAKVEGDVSEEAADEDTSDKLDMSVEEVAADAGDDGEEPSSIAAEVEHETVSEPVDVETLTAGESAESGVVEVHSTGGDESEVESVGADDAVEEVRRARRFPRKQYKIQEVIKRRQILLVQVVKEERGNKGAALTTYLSLAGRYSVLMPNTARGGGISRKITNAQDRKRLKEVVQELGVPDGMGVILRTAGESRTKAEIKRDYEYLMRMWENVRNLTLQSSAPALVYEEGSLIKRSVRDLYNKDIDEILVSGEDGYREAKDFMRMLMPSHAKVVQPYRDTTPIFARAGIEAQLDRMLQPQVTLKSGGYIIINQTEALVSIDVNSGRSTREHSIEDTALQTNLEASEEVARQLRLRDLAGLIVIDYIDMEENRNNRAVEKKLKDCLKNDRARIQVGRISHFGLLEMSRQRIRASVLESTMKPCPHCGGTGHVRSDSSVALHVVRAIEEFLLKDARHNIAVRTPTSTALYVLNHKRAKLAELEVRFGLTIGIEPDESVASQHYVIVRGTAVEKPVTQPATLPLYADEPEDNDIVEVEDDAEAEAEAPAPRSQQSAGGEERDGQRDRKKRRRRRRRGRDREGGQAGADAGESVEAAADQDEADDGNGVEAVELTVAETDEAANGDASARKRRRGKRGGKRHRREDAPLDAQSDDAETQGFAEDVMQEDEQSPQIEESVAAVAETAVPEEVVVAETGTTATAAKAPARSSRRKADGEPSKPRARKTKAKTEVAVTEPEAVAEAPVAVTEEAVADAGTPARPARRTRRSTEADATPPSEEPTVVESTNSEEPAEAERPKRGGWWQRKSFF